MARERIVIGLKAATTTELLIRRAARILPNGGGGELVAVHVRTPEGSRSGVTAGPRGAAPAVVAARRHLPDPAGR